MNSTIKVLFGILFGIVLFLFIYNLGKYLFRKEELNKKITIVFLISIVLCSIASYHVESELLKIGCYLGGIFCFIYSTIFNWSCMNIKNKILVTGTIAAIFIIKGNLPTNDEFEELATD